MRMLNGEENMTAIVLEELGFFKPTFSIRLLEVTNYLYVACNTLPCYVLLCGQHERGTMNE